MTLKREGDGSISMRNAYRTAGGLEGEFRETYRFDPETNLWTWSTVDSVTQSTETGTAPPWTGKTWTFDGVRRGGAKSESIQMVYTRIADDSFRRTFLSDRRGTWETTSSSICNRKN